MIIRKAFKYKLKPRAEQKQQFASFAGACRYVYNRGLAQRKQAYQENKQNISYYEQNKELTLLKQQKESTWLKTIHSQILQQSLKDLNTAYTHYFKKTNAHPKFKAKGIHDSFRYPQGVKIQDDKAYLPKIGWVRYIKSREMQGTLKQTTIIREGEHWYISFSCEIEAPTPNPAPLDENKAIGIDVGLTKYATCAIGNSNKPLTIDPPKYYHRLLPRLRILQKRLSKKQKGSSNWKKAKRQLFKLHAKIKHARENFTHQLSTWIVKNHNIICVETLNIKALMQDKKYKLARYISDASWRQFLTYLKYKAQEQGKHYIEAGAYNPTTKQCSTCGHKQEIELKQRTYSCKNCSLELDRDYNSSINIKAAGTSVLKKLVEQPARAA
ncbi:MAG: IS200/IS605 family element transposase accessory protein TnpB [Chlamydiales bacterium]|nr:IS200/IS605 family element transposase accessory protein TnpB [Chlamydiales bacterium]